MESGGYPVQPAFEAPPRANAESTTAAPAKTNSQSPAAARPGIAIRVAPIISGTMLVTRPVKTGIRTKKTSRVPCMVSSALVGAASEHGSVGPGHLQPHQQRQDAGDQEEHAGPADVERADALVIDRDEPPGDAAPVPRVGGLGGTAHRGLLIVARSAGTEMSF